MRLSCNPLVDNPDNFIINEDGSITSLDGSSPFGEVEHLEEVEGPGRTLNWQ